MTQVNGIHEIETLLSQWASYKVQMANGEIGWPTKSLTAAAADGSGMRGFPSSGVCLILKFDKAQQIDSWINSMGREFPDYKIAVINYYTRHDLPVHKIASKLGISKSALLQRIHNAKLWLCGRLNAQHDAQTNQNN